MSDEAKPADTVKAFHIRTGPGPVARVSVDGQDVTRFLRAYHLRHPAPGAWPVLELEMTARAADMAEAEGMAVLRVTAQAPTPVAPRCATCRHWGRMGSLKDVGTCNRVNRAGVLNPAIGDLASIEDTNGNTPAVLDTHATFGCVQHEARG